MRRHAGEAGGGLPAERPEFGHVGEDHRGDAGADAGDGDEDLPLAGECRIGRDRRLEPAFHLGAGGLQRGDHRAMAGGDLRAEGLGEAGLLHGDELGQLPPAGGKRLERKRFGLRGGAEAVGHGASKARDQAGVQPVGLGDAPLGGAEGADLARVGDADLEAFRDQRGGQRPGVGTDRLERDAPRATPAQRLDERADAGRVVPDAQRPGGGLEAEVEKALADVDAGDGRGCEHVIPVLYAAARRSGDRPTVRIEHSGARGRAGSDGRAALGGHAPAARRNQELPPTAERRSRIKARLRLRYRSSYDTSYCWISPVPQQAT
jgi:hypothetical protein